MSEEHIRIKRYPNRRFYASHTSKYVSLTEIEQMIRDGGTAEIVDSQTGDDITRTVLVQIIAERHPDKMTMFPSAMLHKILRANDAMAQFLQEYFRNSLSYLDHFQKHGTPETFEQPAHWMKSWLDNWSMGPANESGQSTPTVHDPDTNQSELLNRIGKLEQRIAEMEEEKQG